MPFKSKSQIRRFGELVKEKKMSQAEFDRYMADTPNAKALPERIHNGTKVRKVKKVKTI